MPFKMSEMGKKRTLTPKKSTRNCTYSKNLLGTYIRSWLLTILITYQVRLHSIVSSHDFFEIWKFSWNYEKDNLNNLRSANKPILSLNRSDRRGQFKTTLPTNHGTKDSSVIRKFIPRTESNFHVLAMTRGVR